MGNGDPRLRIRWIVPRERVQFPERLLRCPGHEVRLGPFVADGQPVRPKPSRPSYDVHVMLRAIPSVIIEYG